ncbi:MAG TPA: histidinol dehydrogenase, partial [Acidimicrobiales bacterium]|nr:histidinol dehydrogenase [Acidimicrobiales bacterium]
AVALSNVIAPEHLELMVEGAEDLLPLVRSAGAVFLGPYAPASLGDYVAGPNHVLPTARTARFASALRVDDFRTHIHAVGVDAAGLARLAPHVVAIATAEGLPAHAASVLVRRP